MDTMTNQDGLAVVALVLLFAISALWLNIAGGNQRQRFAHAHELKTWPDPFAAMWRDSKRFEIRQEDDRRFAVGDAIWLREWNQTTRRYTGRNLLVVVTYLARGPAWGLALGTVVMSTSIVDRWTDDEPAAPDQPPFGYV